MLPFFVCGLLLPGYSCFLSKRLSVLRSTTIVYPTLCHCDIASARSEEEGIPVRVGSGFSPEAIYGKE